MELRMKLAPPNVYLLCRKACCAKHDPSKMENEIYANDDGQKKKKHGAHYIIAHQSRPLDVIGYFSNHQLFLKIDEETGKLKDIESDSEDAFGGDDEDDLADYHLDTGNGTKEPKTTNFRDIGGEGDGNDIGLEMMTLNNAENDVADDKEAKIKMLIGLADDTIEALGADETNSNANNYEE